MNENISTDPSHFPAYAGPHFPATRASSTRILIAEDDEMLTKFLGRMLRSEGFLVEAVSDGADVLKILQSSDFDLLLLDLNLPTVDGIGVLEALRPGFPRLPVLVLTARPREKGTLQALEHGADDCLTKPFSYAELVARIKALLRREVKSQDLTLTSRCGDLSLDRQQLKVMRGSQRVALSQREFALLEYLMRTPGVPVARSTLLQEIWGSACEPSTNVVDVYMKYVRDKVDLPGLQKLIRTVRGVGYAVSQD